MAYADFTTEDVFDQLGVTLEPGVLFDDVRPVPPPAWLVERLAKNTALAFLNEKSRSERIVTPVLTAVEEMVPPPCAVFSGYRLDVDREAGLVGECDFLIALTLPVPLLRPPIVTLVEAKRGEIELSYGQCVAQMVGAQRFNARHGAADRPVYGCITSGSEWLFLRLAGTVVTAEPHRRALTDVGLLLGIFLHIATAFQPTN